MVIKIATGGAAFRDAFSGEENELCEAAECRRILKNICEQLDAGYRDGVIMDVNGNRVGEWSM